MASLVDRPIVCPTLVGRAPYLAALDAQLTLAREGRGETLVIAGEAGIGKSRLVAEATTRAVAREMRVLIGRCFEPDRVLPYAPLRELATPLLDISGAMPFTAIQSAFDPFFPKGLLQYWKSTYVDALSDDLIDALCDLAARRPSLKTTMDIWPQSGAVARVRANATAFGPRLPFMVAFESTWTDPADNEANIAWARGAWASMQRIASRGIYLNFPRFGEERENLARAAYGANVPRLQALKSRHDPTNLFRINLNIPPSN